MAISENRHEMLLQDPSQRIRNFNEVALGYDEETALAEAQRCLHCVNRPCVRGCPVGIRIPDFIMKIQEKEYDEAYRIIAESS